MVIAFGCACIDVDSVESSHGNRNDRDAGGDMGDQFAIEVANLKGSKKKFTWFAPTKKRE